LLGLAVGDAVGTTLEFRARDTYPPLRDMVGGGPFGLEPGQWTDDTAMALALAESLLSCGGIDERDLMERFVAWWRDGAYSCTGDCFDIGVATSNALAAYERTGSPVCGSTDPRSAGNGSLMRLAPAVLHGLRHGGTAEIARRQSATTHAAAACLDACEHFSALLEEAIGGAPREAVLASRRVEAEAAVAAVIAGRWRGQTRAEIPSSGYVVHSLEAALWCVGETADFREAVLLAANLGDDADTTAAITGQLAGALYGRSGISPEWLERLAWRERIEAVGRALLA
jgi:ADP-ribosyl-[dinitrogen reductase] hydrolase